VRFIPQGRSLRRWPGAVLALLVVFSPQISQACAVCFSARDENRAAFLTTTILLTLSPLLMIGGVIWWLRRCAQRSHQTARDQRAERAPLPS
jgi:protein-S-isoprenylcysteine O-methyltransferase Ste14